MLSAVSDLPDSPTSRDHSLARLTPSQARTVLCGFVAVTAVLIGISLSPLRSGYADAPSRGAGDVELYHAEVVRMRAGENYYLAAKTELEARGYPTRSILNWRTPLPMAFVAALPNENIARGLLIAIAIAVLGLACHAVANEHGMAAAGLTLAFLSGGVLPAMLPTAYLMPEVWCGLFLALSLVSYALNWQRTAVLAGITALFLRELAAPYCLLCALFALRKKRWREVESWAAGLVAYALFYAWHVSQVLPLIHPDARAHSESWFQLGGAAFVISLVQMNVYLLLLPQWVSAVFLVLALVGFAEWTSPWGRRAAWTACVYVVHFGFLGQPFNQYWGSVIAPLLAFGAAQGVVTIKQLCALAHSRCPHESVARL